MSFAGPTDMQYAVGERFLRFFGADLLVLPFKIIPYYVLFYYLLPTFFVRKQYVKILTGFSIALFLCVFGYRLVVYPATLYLYPDTEPFDIFSWNRIMYTLIDIMSAVAVASTIKLLKIRQESVQKEQALQKDKFEAELNFLKAQTNPHFLFNTLNNLYGLARRKDDNTAPSIMKLSNIMRYILYQCNKPSVRIGSEVEVLRDFIALEKLRYDDRLNVRFETNIDDESQEIAPLILLPFVENAFKHGASESRFNASVEIHLVLKDKDLTYIVENTVDDENLEHHEGVGLNNVRRQLELIYGHNASLDIYTQENFYKIFLKINLKSWEVKRNYPA